MHSRAALRFYNERGTVGSWIKERKQAAKLTRLRCHRFRSNEVRLVLSLITYKLGKRPIADNVAEQRRDGMVNVRLI